MNNFKIAFNLEIVSLKLYVFQNIVATYTYIFFYNRNEIKIKLPINYITLNQLLQLQDPQKNRRKRKDIEKVILNNNLLNDLRQTHFKIANSTINYV